jgi:hypothetical protein
VEYAVGDHDVRACLVRDHPKRSADVLVGLVIVGSGTVPVVVE